MSHQPTPQTQQPHLHTSIDASKAHALKQTYTNRISHIDDLQFVTTSPALSKLDRLQHQMIRMHHYIETLQLQQGFQADLARELDAMFTCFQQEGSTPALEGQWQQWLNTLSQGARSFQHPEKVSQWVNHFLPGFLNSRKLPSNEQLRQMVMFWEERNHALKDEITEAAWLQRRLMVTIENVQAASPSPELAQWVEQHTSTTR
jgi:hypothetical protein